MFLLAFTGAGGETTDVLAHLTGFLTGALAGIALATRAQPFAGTVQTLCGLIALASVALAWAFAIASGGGQ